MRAIRAASALAVAVVAGTAGTAQAIDVTVDTRADRRPISPLVYGVNASAGPGFDALLARIRPGLVRLGGNRWTAYNWETNASNAGSDYGFQNDGFLSSSTAPGAAVLPTVRAATAAGAAAMVTVPIVDRVAADRNGGGDIRGTQGYETARLRANHASGGPAGTTPDPGDGDVFQDQFATALRAAVPGAQLLLSLDNEPDLWSATHPEVHPAKATYAEVAQRGSTFARRLKEVAPDAAVAGPVSYGWYGYETLQDAPDAGGRQFLDDYLRRMASASGAAGRRLLDDLDLHWYPEARGDGVRVTGTETSPGVVAAREQAPRSLWDPGYVEDSWIAQSLGGKPIRLVPRLQDRVADAFPGTRLSFSEWNFGGGQDISGAIATADVLGTFGRQGVHAAAWWPLAADNEFAYAAFQAFRNYDGRGGAFGDTAVRATTSDAVRSSVYASVDGADPGRVVLVAINKATTPQPAHLVVAGGAPAERARAWVLTGATAAPVPAAGLAAAPAGTFDTTLPAQSVTMVVPEPVAPGPGGTSAVPGTTTGPAGATPAAGGRVRLADVLRVPSGRSCLRRLRLVVPSAARARVASVTVRLGSRRATVVRGAALRRPILRRLPAGRTTVRLAVRLGDRRNLTLRRVVRRCG